MSNSLSAIYPVIVRKKDRKIFKSQFQNSIPGWEQMKGAKATTKMNLT